ncbi:MAG: VOC family protein [Cellvibrionales bacterium]|jgi:catechol-2,3-dioxygenase|nr:VOC family protein [Cellvibrionales bacterium]MBK8676482.1 VOC family protein [Cellvibrionales bacterium]TXH49615.1 MAG: VOC family protein [Cellvibrionales bacterium]
MSFAVSRIDHAVYWVRDVQQSKDFYTRVLGLQEVVDERGACLLRAPSSDQHHDLGLFQADTHATRTPRGAAGLYHIAWKVTAIEDLAAALHALQQANALTGASSHGATKSVYGVDPDGNEIEITFTIPRHDWGEWEHGGTVERLDLATELARYGTKS